jgi:hypothetical protein
MRTVPLKTLGDLKAVEMLIQVVKQPTGTIANGGTTIEQMRNDIRLLDKLEPAQDMDSITLEDADWAHLRTKLSQFPFGIADRRIIEICEDVFNAPAS